MEAFLLPLSYGYFMVFFTPVSGGLSMTLEYYPEIAVDKWGKFSDSTYVFYIFIVYLYLYQLFSVVS